MFQKAPPTPPTIIRFIGVWDMQDLYGSIADWFRRRKYKLHEKVYKHKHPSPFGVERQYIWQADRKENEYVMATLNLYFHTYDAHDIEMALPDGTKKIYTRGRLWMELRVKLTFDYEKKWNKKLFYKNLKKFYNDYIIRKRTLQGYSPKFRLELYRLHAFIKNRLKLENDQFEWRHAVGVFKRT